MEATEVKEDVINKKKRWNLFNKDHIVPSDKYRENYDRVRWDQDDDCDKRR